MDNTKFYLEILSICFMAALVYVIVIGIITGGRLESLMFGSIALAVCIPLNLKYNDVLRSLIKKWRK